VPGAPPALFDGQSWLRLEPAQVVLSAVTQPEETSEEDLLVRFYETSGQPCMAKLFVRQASAAWRSDLRERRLEALNCQAGQIEVDVKPFEIVTLLVAR
jgi:alpha-mannosidase